MFHGVNPVQLHRIAFDFAEQNKMKHNFNRQNCAAGKDWLYTHTYVPNLGGLIRNYA